MNRVFVLFITILMPILILAQLPAGFKMLEETDSYVKVFVPLPPKLAGQDAITERTGKKIDIFIAQFNDMKITYTGTADSQTRVYDSLKDGILASPSAEEEYNITAAKLRAREASEMWAGEEKYKLVTKKEERGLIIEIQLKEIEALLSPVLESESQMNYIGVKVSQKKLVLLEAESFNLSNLAYIINADSSQTRNDGRLNYRSLDKYVLKVYDNSVVCQAQKPGSTKMVVSITGMPEFTDTVDVSVLPHGWYVLAKKYIEVEIGAFANQAHVGGSYVGGSISLRLYSGWQLSALWGVKKRYFNNKSSMAQFTLGHSLIIDELYIYAGYAEGWRHKRWSYDAGVLGLEYGLKVYNNFYLFGRAQAMLNYNSWYDSWAEYKGLEKVEKVERMNGMVLVGLKYKL